MTTALGYALLCAAIVLVWRQPTERKSWVPLFAAFGFASAGVYFTGMIPHAAAAGVLMFAIAATRFVQPEFARFLLAASAIAFLASAMAFSVGQFGNPWAGETRKEDRNDWEPIVIRDLTDIEKLDLPWSTTDKTADWPVMEIMRDLCQISYLDPVDARSKIEDRGFESETINSGSMNGYVVKAGDHAIIVLRGTESSLYDVLQDLLFIKSTNDNGSMHGGFRSGYSVSMHRQVNDLLERFRAKQVWITGHSLGGALSVVCAHDLLVDDKYPIAGVMTFGQPKVVRSDMRRFLEPKLDGKYVFFVNDMDPVVRAVDPFTHFGHMVRYSDGEIERSERSLLRSFGAADSQSTQTQNDQFPDSFSEAKLDAYIQNLSQPQSPMTNAPSGEPPLMQGWLPTPSDHFIANYREMVDFLIRGKDKSQAVGKRTSLN
ncbi:lipase family protein [Planctomycetaceae bacterium SH139]